MFTVTFVLYEKAGLDRDESLRYWRETHGPIVAKVPGVERYVQQHAVAAPDGKPPFLGVASLSFADQDGFGVAAASPEFAAALGVSKRTLEQWEQGRRQPSGAASTLLRIAERHPEVLLEVAA